MGRDGSIRGYKKGLDFGDILKVELLGFGDRLDYVERKMILGFLVCIYLRENKVGNRLGLIRDYLLN